MKKSIVLSIVLLAHSMVAACPTCGGKKKKSQQNQPQEHVDTMFDTMDVQPQQQGMSRRKARPKMAAPKPTNRSGDEQDLYDLEVTQDDVE